MGWKGKEREPALYERLVETYDEGVVSDRARKGYVPVLVGREPEMERFLVHVKLFSDPCIVVLLEMAADKLGEKQEGILRIPCEAEHFRRVVSVIAKAR